MGEIFPCQSHSRMDRENFEKWLLCITLLSLLRELDKGRRGTAASRPDTMRPAWTRGRVGSRRNFYNNNKERGCGWSCMASASIGDNYKRNCRCSQWDYYWPGSQVYTYYLHGITDHSCPSSILGTTLRPHPPALFISLNLPISLLACYSRRLFKW